MPRLKKEAVPSSFRLQADLVERLERFCADSGQSKTTAVERALTMYIDDYDEKMKKIKEE